MTASRPRRRRVLLALGVLLVVAIAGVLGLHAHHRARLGGDAFDEALLRLVERSQEAAARASDFDARAALRDLGANPRNGFVYRLDERVDEAVADFPEGMLEAPGTPASAGLPSFEFDGADPHSLEFADGDTTLRDGFLVVTVRASEPLRSKGELVVPPSRVGEIRIRLRAERGREALFGWSDGERARGRVALRLRPGGEFHTYAIDAASLLRDSLSYDTEGSRRPIREVSLVPSDVPGDAVELDYVRLVSREAVYADVAHGVTHASAGDELRSCVHVRSPGALTYTVDLPAGERRLSTGLAVVVEGAPVTFRVLAGARELARVTVSAPDRWHDFEVDLGELAPGPTALTLAAQSAVPNVALWGSPAVWGPPAERRHVLLLVEDTLRADHLSLHGAGRPTSPFKDELFAAGVVFENAFSQATKTRGSCPSLMTSLYPTATGVWNSDDVLAEGFLTLAEVLRSQGFETAAFVQNPNAGPAAGLHQGFSSVFDRERAGDRAGELYGEDLFAWIERNRDRNLFLYLHVLDPHGPYDPLSPDDAWFREAAPPADGHPHRSHLDPEGATDVSLAGRRLLYDGEIRGNDRALAGLVGRLEEAGLWADTLFVFASDHGEHLGERGLWEHHPPGFTQVVHVPLAFHAPGRLAAGRRIRANVQLLDVMPTILELCGIPTAPLLLQGDSLAPLLGDGAADEGPWDRRMVLSEELVQRVGKDDTRPWASLFVGRWHLLNSRGFTADSLLPDSLGLRVFDRRADRQELHRRASFSLDLLFARDVAAALRRIAENDGRVWRALAGEGPGALAVDPEAERRLRELGY